MKNIFTSILILLVQYAYSQTASLRNIVDQQTNKPIPFATVKILNKPLGVIASEKGEFSLEIEHADSVLFTSVGYKSKIIIGKNIEVLIHLESKAKTLDEITVQATKFMRSLILGYDTSKFNKDWNWGPGGQAEFAQRMDLPDSNQLYKLKKVFLRIKKNDCYGPLLLHIYSTDTITGQPGEEILTKPVYFNKSNVKKNKATIDVSEDNLYWKGDKSFFIGFSWFPGAWEQQCVTTLFFLPSTKYTTFSRTIVSKNYTWFHFNRGKDESGNPSPASTFFSVEVDELK